MIDLTGGDEIEDVSPIRRSEAGFFYDGSLMKAGGAKNPINLLDSDEEDMDEDGDEIQWGEEPDLALFFQNFPWIEPASQIAICRTFANYLASQLRAKDKKDAEWKKRARQELEQTLAPEVADE